MPMTLLLLPLAFAYLTAMTMAVDAVYRATAVVRSRLVTDSGPDQEGGAVYALGLIPPVAGIAVAAACSFLLPGMELMGQVRASPAVPAALSGAIVASVCCGLVCALAVTLGYIRPHAPPRSEVGVRASSFALVGLDLFLWATFEEIVFRGQLMQCLLLAVGREPAVLLSSLIFGAMHLLKNRNAPTLWVVNTVLFGTVAAELVIVTGSLASAVALHFIWNLLETPILGLPANGIEYDRGLLRSELSGPALVTGGGWSLDAGLIATASLAGGLVMLRLLG